LAPFIVSIGVSSRVWAPLLMSDGFDDWTAKAYVQTRLRSGRGIQEAQDVPAHAPYAADTRVGSRLPDKPRDAIAPTEVDGHPDISGRRESDRVRQYVDCPYSLSQEKIHDALKTDDACIACWPARFQRVAGDCRLRLAAGTRYRRRRDVDLAEANKAAETLFDKLDHDHDGTLDAKEVRRRLSKGDFAAADLDKDGTLSKDEYLALVEKRFKEADSDHDGTLTAAELRSKAGRALLKLLQ
jgi:EF hand